MTTKGRAITASEHLNGASREMIATSQESIPETGKNGFVTIFSRLFFWNIFIMRMERLLLAHRCTTLRRILCLSAEPNNLSHRAVQHSMTHITISYESKIHIEVDSLMVTLDSPQNDRFPAFGLEKIQCY